MIPNLFAATSRVLAASLLIASSAPPVAFAAGDYSDWKQRPADDFTGGEKAYAEARAILEKHYVDEVSEPELYRASVQGMLSAPGRKWDQLLSPSEWAEIKQGLSGEVVGIGAEVRYDADTGMTKLVSIVPGSAAEKAGLLPGDVVLKVDGKFFKGMQERDVIYAIRGKEGETVTLTVLRGDRIFEQQVRREKVAIVTVTDAMLPGEVGLVTVHVFNDRTPLLVDEALHRLAAKKARGLILDLRGNPGGLFERVIDVAQLLLPSGSTFVTAVERGGKKKPYVVNRAPVLGKVPVAVLVDGSTFSGAELLAGALRDHLRATLIGTRTGGKWNVQRIEKLSNGYALKFTTAVFESPSGQRLDGVGLTPDFEVAMDATELTKARRLTEMKQRLAADPALRTAHSALRK